jgi:hypothetical protein
MIKETYNKEELIQEAEYLKSLCCKIVNAAKEFDDTIYSHQQCSGTIYNLTPEISKTSSKIRKMVRLVEVKK